MTTKTKRPVFRAVNEAGVLRFREVEDDGTIGGGTHIIDHRKKRPEDYACKECGSVLLTIHFPIEIEIKKISCLRCHPHPKVQK